MINDYYPWLLTLHLFGAVIFVGTVFFEVLILESIRKKTSVRFMAAIESAIGARATRIMPWVLFMLYGAGIGMVLLRYSAFVLNPFESTFGLLLSLKILLTISVFGHFCTAMIMRVKGKLNGTFFKYLHLSVFTHMVFILLLAKWMFY